MDATLLADVAADLAAVLPAAHLTLVRRETHKASCDRRRLALGHCRDHNALICGRSADTKSPDRAAGSSRSRDSVDVYQLRHLVAKKFGGRHVLFLRMPSVRIADISTTAAEAPRRLPWMLIPLAGGRQEAEIVHLRAARSEMNPRASARASELLPTTHRRKARDPGLLGLGGIAAPSSAFGVLNSPIPLSKIPLLLPTPRN